MLMTGIFFFFPDLMVLIMCHSLLLFARMHRKNGQFASLKENSGGSGWDSAQNCLQDGTPRTETV